MSSTTKSSRRAPRSGKTRAGASANGTKGTKAGSSKRSASDMDALRLELRSLKKLVLLQKAKQQLLRSKTIGPAQLNSLLSDYLKVVLTLTGTAAGSILLFEDHQLVFRAASGPGSPQLLGKRLSLDEGIAGWVCRTGKTYLSSDVSRDTQWSSRISAELRFPTQNILCAPLTVSEKVIGVIEIINKKRRRPFGKEDREMLETLAGQLSMDIAYAMLLSESMDIA